MAKNQYGPAEEEMETMGNTNMGYICNSEIGRLHPLNVEEVGGEPPGGTEGMEESPAWALSAGTYTYKVPKGGDPYAGKGKM